jgi:ornithine carbamoyltransferase
LNANELTLVLETARALKEEWRAAHPLPRKPRGQPSALEGLTEALEERGERGQEGRLFGQDLWPSLRNRGVGGERGAVREAEAEAEAADADSAMAVEAPPDAADEGAAAGEAVGKRGEEAPVERAEGPPTPRPLVGKTLALVFEKPSLRTRVSFDVGMRQLGGECVYVSPAEVGLGNREPVEDVARVLSRYVDCIAARTFAHSTVEELGRWSEVPVINALSEGEHPCQALADFLTMMEQKERLRGLKLAYIGDGNNVARSLCLGAAALGMEFRIASPRGYELDSGTISGARVLGGTRGGSLVQTQDPREAAHGADVVYTDVWASMGQEEESAARVKAFAGYQVDMELMAVAKGDAIFMHDLPAHRGEEVTADVMESEASVVWEQAENRMHAQKAVLALVLGGEV